MARYSGCGICMKVCPIQKYGMKPVMEHYVETGKILGKGTHDLEGYNIEGKGYFGPGQLPSFQSRFFDIPKGKLEDALFDDFKARLKNNEIPEGSLGDDELRSFRGKLQKYVDAPVEDAMAGAPEES
tara:strand:+ start:214 stop:594 length:381 start_codon:yes stop_codon:yes gene_type:complete